MQQRLMNASDPINSTWGNATGINAAANTTAADYAFIVVITFVQIFNILMTLPSVAFLIITLTTVLGSAALRESSRYLLFVNLLACDSCFLVNSNAMATLVWRRVTIAFVPCYMYITLASVLNHAGAMFVTAMSVERYAAVCHPLRYHGWFGLRATLRAIACIWSAASVCPLVEAMLAFSGGSSDEPSLDQTSLCVPNRIDSLLRHRTALVALRELANSVTFITSVAAMLFTYTQIVRAARKSAASGGRGGGDGGGGGEGDLNSARRARNTVALHGLQLLLYLSALGNEVFLLLLVFVTSNAKIFTLCRISLYMVLFVTSRMVIPLVYGLRDQELRRQLKRRLACGASGKVRQSLMHGPAMS
uniref:Odorant receptor 131-2-like n=1 Tax=Petromyzon marinus TaxID=7757 RepID=A0AAJ7UDI2_PETMA|nr:odorant receptor 131-2-like [Petromyzon marinus]XP_032834282.1 odorant receptor 131-2-like [Petromyzon marinus]